MPPARCPQSCGLLSPTCARLRPESTEPWEEWSKCPSSSLLEEQCQEGAERRDAEGRKLVEAGRDVILAWRLPPHSTLAPLSVKFPDSSVAGFLTLPPPTNLPHTHAHTWTWTHTHRHTPTRTHEHEHTCVHTRTDGVLMPTYESPGALVRVWLVLEEEWTWWEVWAQ